MLHLREGKWCRPLGTRWAEDLSLGIARRQGGVASVDRLRCWRESAVTETVCRPPCHSSRRVRGVSRTLQRAKRIYAEGWAVRYIEDAILVKLMGLLQESGMPAAILVLVIFSVLSGYAVATMRVVLAEVRELKAGVHEMKAEVREMKAGVREVGAGVREVRAEIREVKAQAREDCRVNKSDHDRLFNEVSDLEADVKVLRDRSDRSSADAG